MFAGVVVVGYYSLIDPFCLCFFSVWIVSFAGSMVNWVMARTLHPFWSLRVWVLVGGLSYVVL